MSCRAGLNRAEIYIKCLMAGELDFYYRMKARGLCWTNLSMGDRQRINEKAKAAESFIRARELNRL